MSEFSGMLLSFTAFVSGLLFTFGYGTFEGLVVWLLVFIVMLLSEISVQQSRGDDA